ncbi:MAG: TVP38/TMEM64 family protein [Dongiaceae bacterium]
MNDNDSRADGAPANWSYRRLLPILALAAGLGLVFAFGLQDYLSCATLRDNRAALLDWVGLHRLLAALGFMAIYVAAVALSVPGGAALTVAGGFLFGSGWATGMVVVAATLGAAMLFLAARTAVGDLLRAKAGPWLGKLERGFAANALNYLLVLRLVPLFPFFVVNLVPAFLGVSLRTYVIGTFVGIIPGTFVFASVGAGLGSIFDAGGECSFDNVLTPEVVIALLGLAALSLIPVFYKMLAARRPAGRRIP